MYDRYRLNGIRPLYFHVKLLYHIPMPTTNSSSLPKHQRIYRTLAGEITRGRWKTGERLPSEAELVDRFGASRITVGRAMSDLQRAGLAPGRIWHPPKPPPDGPLDC